jgi:hypothetical protein
MHSLLTPVLALITLTLLVWIWMYATRIPAMQKAGISPQAAKHPGTWEAGVPSSARQVAENYNHLLEQPTIFYALVFYIVLAAHSDQLHIYLAWAYVVLRVVHTLIQCTVNLVPMRFLVFSLSTIALMIMAGREIVALM